MKIRSCTFHPSHTRWTDWLHSSTEVGCSSCFTPKKKDPSFPLSAHAICQTELLYFFHLLDTRRLFKHNLFPQAFPWERYPTFTPLFSFLLLLLVMTLLYLFTAGCLFFYWLFYKGYEWALSQLGWALYIETFSHTHPVSQLAVCRWKRWRICDGQS